MSVFLTSAVRTGSISFALLAFSALPAHAQRGGDVEQEIMDLAYQQWEAEMQGGSPEEIGQQLHDDYTEFNPMTPTRIDGKKTAMKMIKTGMQSDMQPVMSEMLNPKVQVYDDTAILSYNYMGMLKGEDGAMEPSMAKSTRVYVKDGRDWKLVHANFAPVMASLED